MANQLIRSEALAYPVDCVYNGSSKEMKRGLANNGVYPYDNHRCDWRCVVFTYPCAAAMDAGAYRQCSFGGPGAEKADGLEPADTQCGIGPSRLCDGAAVHVGDFASDS